jgi:hypothetical protein
MTQQSQQHQGHLLTGGQAGPDNFVVEYTTALERISDEDAWVPRIWPAAPEYADRWGTAGPGEDLFALWHRTPPETGLWVPAPV